MNRPFYPATAPAEGSVGYDADVHAWAIAQATALRERRLDAIDWEHVAEEIEDVARREQDKAESFLRVALMHLLKWRYQPERRGNSWRNSIKVHLHNFDRQIAKHPSLKAQLEDIRADAYDRARGEASIETDLDLETFPLDPPSWDEIRAPLQP